MGTQDNEINRNIDTAEGHVRHARVEQAEDAGERTSIKHHDALDDEAEGHVVRFVGDAEDAEVR